MAHNFIYCPLQKHDNLVVRDVTKLVSEAIISLTKIGVLEFKLPLEYGSIERFMVGKRLVTMDVFDLFLIREKYFVVIIVTPSLDLGRLGSKRLILFFT